MEQNLHIKLQWLEEEVTSEKRAEYERYDAAGRLAVCREVLRKNSTAVGLRKRDIDSLRDEEIMVLAGQLYQRYRHYIDRMERDERKRKR